MRFSQTQRDKYRSDAQHNNLNAVETGPLVRIYNFGEWKSFIRRTPICMYSSLHI